MSAIVLFAVVGTEKWKAVEVLFEAVEIVMSTSDEIVKLVAVETEKFEAVETEKFEAGSLFDTVMFDSMILVVAAAGTSIY